MTKVSNHNMWQTNRHNGRLAMSSAEKPVRSPIEELTDYIVNVPDYPRPGVQFKDITNLLKSPRAFRSAIGLLTAAFIGEDIDAVVSIESRGFLIGAPVAFALNTGVVPVRKKGKLPRSKITTSYELEYGTDSLEMHTDGISKEHRIVIIDDVLATGGTAKAVSDLVASSGGKVVGYGFLIELDELKGKEKLVRDAKLISLLHY